MLTCDAELAAGDSAADSSATEPDHRQRVARSLVPLVIDVGIPVGSYYLLHAGLGLSLWLSLALSSVVPAVRSVTGLVAQRELNVLALLMLFVNVAGIAVSFATGDPRLMIARTAAWDRLAAGSALPVPTMVWLGTALTGAAVGVAITAGGAAAALMQKLIETETRAGADAGAAGR
ncbi:MAG: VC0807 family protein [Streptosporangiaceae bacterium]